MPHHFHIPHWHFPHFHLPHPRFPRHMTLLHTLAILIALAGTGFFTPRKPVSAKTARIDAVAVFHRAPSYRLRVVSPSAKGRAYMDLNITERDKTEILPGEISCIPRPLNEFYEDDQSGGKIDYCEIVFH